MEGRKSVSTLEKTINLLNILPESQIEMIYNFVQFLSSQYTVEKPFDTESLDDIFSKIATEYPNPLVRYGALCVRESMPV